MVFCVCHCASCVVRHTQLSCRNVGTSCDVIGFRSWLALTRSLPSSIYRRTSLTPSTTTARTGSVRYWMYRCELEANLSCRHHSRNTFTYLQGLNSVDVVALSRVECPSRHIYTSFQRQLSQLVSWLMKNTQKNTNAFLKLRTTQKLNMLENN